MFLSRLLVVFVVVAALSALAFDKGAALYLVKDVPLRKAAKLNAAVVAQGVRREKVIWLGAAPKSTGWQEVQTMGGKRGFVETTALTSEVPRDDVARGDGGFSGTKADGGLDADEAALLEAEKMNR